MEREKERARGIEGESQHSKHNTAQNEMKLAGADQRSGSFPSLLQAKLTHFRLELQELTVDLRPVCQPEPCSQNPGEGDRFQQHSSLSISTDLHVLHYCICIQHGCHCSHFAHTLYYNIPIS